MNSEPIEVLKEWGPRDSHMIEDKVRETWEAMWEGRPRPRCRAQPGAQELASGSTWGGGNRKGWEMNRPIAKKTTNTRHTQSLVLPRGAQLAGKSVGGTVLTK